MFTQKQAKKFKMPMTIDLKGMMAQEYLDSKKTNITLLKEKLMKIITIVALIYFIIVICFGWGVITPPKTNAYDNIEQEYGYFLAHFPEEHTVIGCYNDITKKTYELWEAEYCYKRGDHNIMLPPRSQIKIWLRYFNEFEIVNRLALVNFESSFIEENGNKHAYWYVQTLRKYNIAPDIDSQLKWVYDRQQQQKKVKVWNSNRCGYYWSNYNYKDWFEAGEYWVLSCLYRYHYHAHKWTWYAKRGIKTTKFYKKYMFWIEY